MARRCQQETYPAFCSPAGFRGQPGNAESAYYAESAESGRTRLFTVPLSSGHERTLYIFADPQCPHCQDFEPLFEALSTRYNVEIFPVTYVGGKQSSQQIQPVLYLNKDQRAAAWKKLFRLTMACSPLAKRKPVTIKRSPGTTR
jgi:thiol-disulfide isomerase/thioredoxin